jgi:hypothetical protein
MSKIVEGLQAALDYAKCEHDFIVQGMRKMPDGRARVKSRCDRCAGTRVTYYEPGVLRFVEIER